MTKLTALTKVTELLSKLIYQGKEIKTKRNKAKGKNRARNNECNHLSWPKAK